MKLRLRTKNLLFAGAIGALIVSLISSGVIYFLYSNWKEGQDQEIAAYNKKLNELKEYAEGQNQGYVLKEDTKAGTEITEEMLEEVLLTKDSTSEDLLDKSALDGQILRVDLKANTLITSSLLQQEELTASDMRETEYSFIQLPKKLKKDDFVDVRIQFPNGDDYILLSKKKVLDLEEETAWLQLAEEEILTMSSGIVDAYMENAIIYALSYVEPYTQAASQVTYPVKENVKELIVSSPNIVNVAEEALADRGRKKLDEALKNLKENEKKTFKQQQKENEKDKQKTQEEIFEEPVDSEKEE
jgi:hypothetical protein